MNGQSGQDFRNKAALKYLVHTHKSFSGFCLSSVCVEVLITIYI